MTFKQVAQISILIVIMFNLVLSNTAFAQSFLPIVQCGNSVNPAPCTTCDFFKLVKNLIDFTLYVLTPILATVLFIWAGFQMLLAGANPGLYSNAKNIFKNTIYGVIVVLTAWLITNTFIQALGPANMTGNWWQFQCPAGLP